MCVLLSAMAESESQDCIVERDGHVLTVIMNRPEARNAFTPQMLGKMSEAWDEVNENPEIRVAILTGAGGAFSSGADLKAFTRQDPGRGMQERQSQGGGMNMFKPLLKGFRLTKPLIAAVEGPAIAGGTEILQGTDIRVAGESARFGVSEVRWGLFPMGGSTVRLRRQVPYAVAADILLTGRHLTAQEALDVGLITYLVPDGQALGKARELAEMIASNGPLAVQGVLRSLRETEGLPEDEAFKIETDIGIGVFISEDAKEGPKAFSEKRKPDFKGR